MEELQGGLAKAMGAVCGAIILMGFTGWGLIPALILGPSACGSAIGLGIANK